MGKRREKELRFSSRSYEKRYGFCGCFAAIAAVLMIWSGPAFCQDQTPSRASSDAPQSNSVSQNSFQSIPASNMLILKDDGAYAIHLNAEHFDPSSVYPELDYFDALVIELFNQSQIKNRVTERMPWKRVVEIAEQEKGHVLYPTTRTDDREGMFKWVGPISRTIWNLYGISADGWADRSFDDILKNARIGALMGSARESYLRAQGAENLIVMPREELLLPMLMAGRVDLLAIGGNILRHYIDVAASSDDGGGMPEIGGAVAYRTCYLYIAISGDVPDQDISRLQDKLDEFKINGVFTNIRAKFGLSTDEQSPFLQAMLSGENNGVGCVDMNGKP